MKWSFIISYLQGTYLEQVIRSIENQNDIKDNYEIILIGPKLESSSFGIPNIKHIVFEENLIPGWITLKKNIAIQNATHNNLCIMHEYVGLCENWYTNYELFGDEWDVCMNPIRMKNNLRYRDWITLQRPIQYISYHDVTQTKTNMYISGTYWCAKKNFMMQNPLDIRRTWGQGEDIEWSMRCMKNWNYKFNLNSVVKLLKDKPTDDWVPHPSTDINTNIDFSLNLIQQ